MAAYVAFAHFTPIFYEQLGWRQPSVFNTWPNLMSAGFFAREKVR
jgi:hypothetical protein